MFVSPDARRLGIGSKLINQTKQHAKKHGITQIQLRTHESNEGAIRCYENSGFVREDESVYAEFLEANLIFRDVTFAAKI